jgi:Ring finger domain
MSSSQVVTTILYRVLQEVTSQMNDTDTTTYNTTVDTLDNATFAPTVVSTSTIPPVLPGLDGGSGDSGSRGAYEFVAFILWYLFLVLCCIVPTCCAYRRRRVLEARYGPDGQAGITLEQLQQLQQAQQLQNGVYLLPTLQQRQDLFRSAQDLMESDVAKAERTRRLEESLKASTFVVQEGDVIEGGGGIPISKGDVETKEESQDENPAAETSREQSTMQVMEESVLVDLDVTSVLQLPRPKEDGTDYVNANRTVPGVCAICLCGYEIGDSVTWSKQTECQHAFHHECIVPWLAKKNDGQPKCPCCRQVYCSIQPITFSDLMNSNVAAAAAAAAAADSATARSSTATATLSPLEFVMAVRSNGSSLFFPHEFPGTSMAGGAMMQPQGTPITVVAHYNSPYSSTVTTPPNGTPFEDIEAGHPSNADDESESGIRENDNSDDGTHSA